jgi:hypothetical protein
MFDKYIIVVTFVISFITSILLLRMWVKNEDKLYEDD